MFKLIFKLTGGRPMTKIDDAFLDTVDKRPVYYFLDKLGRKWMANHSWSMFRVRVKLLTLPDNS